MVSVALAGFTRSAGAGDHDEIGLASYYAHAFDSLPTASGERFDMHAMTAAHRTLPFGTRVKVTHLVNGRSAVVRINDRGPFQKGRVLDLSYAAARALRLIGPGVGRVRVEAIPRDSPAAAETESPRRRGIGRLWRWGPRALPAPSAARIDVTRVVRDGV
jgi:rare lipoprotein A